MKIVSAAEVVARNKESIDKVTEIVIDWLPILCDRGEVPETNMELIVMPMPYMIDENGGLAQTLVFYDDDNKTPTQLQIAGIWMAGALYTDEDDEELLEVFEPNDERFVRSVLESLLAVLLELKVALQGGLVEEAREVVRSELRAHAVEMVSELIGPPPDAWLNTPEPPTKKVLN